MLLRRSALFRIGLASALAAGLTPILPGGAAVAQFVTPIPTPQPPETIEPGRYQSRFYHSLSKEQRDSIEGGTMDADAIRDRRRRFCERKYTDDETVTRRSNCLAAVDPDTIATRKDARRKGFTEVILPFGILHDRYALEEYLGGSTGSDGLSLFSRFAANISDEEAYVTSDIISGLAGRFMFAINYAAVVVKDESGATASERRSIESQKADVMRMINNGGTLTMRAQLPLFGISGHTGQSAASVYVNSGLVGPTGNTDSLRFAGSGVAEFATTRSIRAMGDAADLLGELLIAARIGYAASEKELLSRTGDNGFGFFQLAIGLLQNNKISLSALYTLPLESRYKPFAPKLTVNFAAIR